MMQIFGASTDSAAPVDDDPTVVLSLSDIPTDRVPVRVALVAAISITPGADTDALVMYVVRGSDADSPRISEGVAATCDPMAPPQVNLTVSCVDEPGVTIDRTYSIVVTQDAGSSPGGGVASLNAWVEPITADA